MATPNQAGQTVTDARGRKGITTEAPPLSGKFVDCSKVMWVGGSWTVREDIVDLELTDW